MRVFLPPSDDHRKVAGSKKSHSSSEELLPQPQEQQHRHQPPPFKKKKVDQCNFSLPPSSSALAFSSGGTVMCPPSLKRGDSDGDDTDNNNFNLRVGEEQHPHMQMHHHGVDNSTSSASANIIVTSSDTINTGTCYDGFKNEALWKGSDYFDNQKQKNDGGDEGLKAPTAAAEAASTAASNIEISTTSGHRCRATTTMDAMNNPADDDSECRGKDNDDGDLVQESLSRTIFLGKSHDDTNDDDDDDDDVVDGDTIYLDSGVTRHSRRRGYRNQSTRKSSSIDAALIAAPAPLLNCPIPGSRDDPATMSKADEYRGSVNNKSNVDIYKHNNINADNHNNLSTFSQFIHLLRTQHKPSLDVVPMDGDGNCLFRAISLQVYGDVTMHMDVRRDCLDYMERDADHFRDFVTCAGHEEFNEYVARKRKNGVHGNHAEIQAMSELYNRSIEVYVPDHGIEPINIFHSEYKGVGDAPIRLCYMDGNHYDAVIDPLLPTAGLGLCLPGLQPGLADKLQLEEAKKKSSDCALEEKMRFALEESHRTNKEREELELREALRKSCEFATAVDSDDDLYKKKAMYLSEIEAAEFDLEQAVLASSLETFQTAEQERKPPSLRRTEGRRSRFNSSPRSLRASSSSPVYQSNSISNATTAMFPSSNQYAASAASFASLPCSASAEESRNNFAAITADEYPACVEELVMNGFELTKVVHAYELIGDNFDDLLSFLLSSTN